MKRFSVNFQKGFSLVELMVAVSILAAVALAAAGVATMMSHANDYSDRKNEQQALSSLIMTNLAHSKNCMAAIGGQVVDANLIQTKASAGGWPVQMNLPSITGVVKDGTALPLRKLQIRSLRFADAVITINAPPTTYLASLILGTDELGGRSQKEIIVGSLTITTDPAGKITNCQSMSDASYQQTCQDMGCTFDGVSNPNTCKCLRTQVVCAAPGYVPVAFSADGLPDCRPVGGAVQCPVGEYLIGVGIDWYKCGPIPTSTPTPPASCSGGATTTVTAYAATPVGCYCTAPNTWNGAICVAPSVPVNGACGAIGSYADATAVNTAGLCSAGTASPASVSGAGPWNWSCSGTNGGSNTNCTATQSLAPIAGSCKASGTYPDAASVNAAGLCSAGTATPTSVSGTAPWNWSCSGSNGGSSASCTATQGACVAQWKLIPNQISQMVYTSCQSGAYGAMSNWGPPYGSMTAQYSGTIVYGDGTNMPVIGSCALDLSGACTMTVTGSSGSHAFSLGIHVFNSVGDAYAVPSTPVTFY